MAVILVADDEKAVRTLVSVALTSMGHEVMTAANGLEAIALFRSYPARIALVITDIKMPLMDGHQVVKLVREIQPHMKIICMSAYTEGFPGCTQILPKPFRMADLRVCVDAALAQE